MAPPKKYLDFMEGDPVIRMAKKMAASADDERQYIPLTCPHCKTIFVEIPVDRLASNKASACRDHMSKCISDTARNDERRPSDTNTAAAVREQTAVMQAQHAESMAVHTEQLASQRRSEEHLRAMREAQRLAICSVLGLSDHSSDDEDGSKAAVRAKRKVETLQATATLDVLGRVAKAGRFSPPRDGEPTVAVGRRVVECVTAVAADAGQVAGLRSQLVSLNAEVGVSTDAAPADRVGAIRQLKKEVQETKDKCELYFNDVSSATGKVHTTMDEQIDYVSYLSKMAAIATIAPKQAESRHIKRIDKAMGLGDRTTQSVRELEIARLMAVERDHGSLKRKEIADTNEFKAALAANESATRRAKAFCHELGNCQWKDKIMQCIPTSGNGIDPNWNRSCTKHGSG